jgi:hypothetical protein
MIRIKAVWLIMVMCLVMFLSSGTSAFAQSHGVHGMALFGDHDGLYASHLPMFHRPHNFQVLLKIRLANASQDQMLRADLAAKPTLYTIAPARFDLERLSPNHADPLQEFTADVYTGHFERGGKLALSQVQIIVQEVPLYHELKLVPALKNAEQTMLVLGRFAIKKIDSQPDCDWLVRIEYPAQKSKALMPMPNQLSLPNTTLGGANCKPDEDALSGALALFIAAPKQSIKLQTLYFETGDLQ